MKKLNLFIVVGLMFLFLGCPRITNVKPFNDQTKMRIGPQVLRF